MKTGTRGLISALALATCFAQSLDAEQTSQGKSSGTTPPAVIAEVNGESITAAEIDKAVGQQIARLEEQIYTLRKQRLDSLIADRLLTAEASKRKITVSALLDAEVNAKVTVVTEAEIDAFIEANKARLKGEGAELRETVRQQLQRQKAAVQRQAFVDSLRAAGSVVVHLPPAAGVPRGGFGYSGGGLEGPCRCANYHHGVHRFPLPVLQRRSANNSDGAGTLRGQSAAGPSRPADRCSPPAGAKSPRGGALRGRTEQVLGVSGTRVSGRPENPSGTHEDCVRSRSEHAGLQRMRRRPGRRSSGSRG